jgi:rare lipoprotein A
MRRYGDGTTLAVTVVATLVVAGTTACVADGGDGGGKQARAEAPAAPPQRGEASYYHPNLDGHRMANGERFDAASNSAAHRSLPLGTDARVTNLETGRSANVTIKDRGPYVRGRIIDVSPAMASRLGMRESGTAPVVVTPTDIPGDGRGAK